MKMSVLRELWQVKNPEGNIWIIDASGKLLEEGRQTGKFGVTYNRDSKIYSYGASSVYKMAERFNLIPVSNIDYFQESRNAIKAMLENQEFSTIAGLTDTIRHICETEFNCYLDFSTTESSDQYDRTVLAFKLIKKYASYQEYFQEKGW